MAKVTAEQAATKLTDWRAVNEQRDHLVRQAHDAGLAINRIHHLSGIARSTIYDILEGKRGRARRTTT
ncbi:hypothetical protein B5P44_00570 [Mycobacterium sp. CBMA 213]|uniref:Helix-turn-helix domain of resolvase n=1 Tax=Mycolicibacterium sp. CBMA 213 TaxID=1968788 RepID=A0A343VR97_9MYCO|nr:MULTISPECIES: hypothetical protein [unclassified Mycolicibacterium]AVN58421.1 hypothetical protein B5P44_p00126 [Mycolicibacterium sp. CBMA 213]MUL61079.1 hypothetical protein [Mycolicibacterium sp. CBMA 335]MUM03317.1 hypothetical protein [Mycolicibacterium sp. CBMA 213]